MQDVKVNRAIKVIKLKGKRLAAFVPATIGAVALAREIQAKTITTVKSWITERRENHLVEKEHSENAMKVWRGQDNHRKKAKIG